MLVTCYVVLAILLTAWGHPKLDIMEIAMTAFFVSLVGTFLEAISVRGLDNLIVPVFSSFAAYIMLKLF
jgi:dolichol kinase